MPSHVTVSSCAFVRLTRVTLLPNVVIIDSLRERRRSLNARAILEANCGPRGDRKWPFDVPARQAPANLCYAHRSYTRYHADVAYSPRTTTNVTTVSPSKRENLTGLR